MAGSVIFSLLAAALLVACSSGSAASFKLTAGQPSSGASSTTAPPAPAPGSQAEFDAYLHQVLRPRLKGNRSIDKCGKRLRHLDSTADSTWDTAAHVCRQTAVLLRRIGDRMSAIVPPAGLNHAHLSYSEGWREDGLIYGAIDSVLPIQSVGDRRG